MLLTIGFGLSLTNQNPSHQNLGLEKIGLFEGQAFVERGLEHINFMVQLARANATP